MSKKKVALVVGIVVMLLLAYRFGVFGALRDPARLRDSLLALGPLGALYFVLAAALLQPFGVPGVMFWVAASLTWPPPIAIALSLAGTVLASIHGFSLSRYVARDWIEKRIPARLRKYDERLATRGFATVFLLRSTLWTNQGLHALFGVSRVRFSTHLVASSLAYVLPIVGFTYLGSNALAIVASQPKERWLVLLLVLAIVAFVSRGPLRRRLCTSSE